jgi:hypothetical protein
MLFLSIERNLFKKPEVRLFRFGFWLCYNSNCGRRRVGKTAEFTSSRYESPFAPRFQQSATWEFLVALRVRTPWIGSFKLSDPRLCFTAADERNVVTVKCFHQPSFSGLDFCSPNGEGISGDA